MSEAIQQIKDRIDIADLIGRTVKLRKSGPKEFVGLCPFHSERTPSFYVIPDKQMWHCFGGCGGGDVFSWLQKSEGLTFPDALEQLAGLAGVELPKAKPDPQRDRHFETMRAILAETQEFFTAQMMADDDALCYLQGRGLTSEFVDRVGIGVAPDTWDMLMKHLKGRGFKDADIEAAGVAAQGNRGGLIDFLRNRITIPIRDHLGKLVAFGGRIIGDGKPKYLNTRETDLFQKGEILFGLHEAKGNATDGVLVVEGYFDVLVLHRFGIKNVVAPLGTALTENHLERLARYSKRIILCFDGDEAGHRAMERSLHLALPKGFDVRLLELPTGEDPDTWAMSIGEEAFGALIRNAPDWTKFKLARAIKHHDMRQLQERFQVLAEFAPLLEYVPAEGREALRATLAHQLQIPAHEIQAKPSTPAAPPQPVKPVAQVQTSNQILALAVAWCSNQKQAAVDTPRDWWLHLQGADLLEEILDSADISHEADHLKRRAEALAARGIDPRLETLLPVLESAYVDASINRLKQSLEDPATPQTALPQYMKAITDLLARRARLNRRNATS